MFWLYIYARVCCFYWLDYTVSNMLGVYYIIIKICVDDSLIKKYIPQYNSIYYITSILILEQYFKKKFVINIYDEKSVESFLFTKFCEFARRRADEFIFNFWITYSKRIEFKRMFGNQKQLLLLIFAFFTGLRKKVKTL